MLGEILSWSLMGVKGLNPQWPYQQLSYLYYVVRFDCRLGRLEQLETNLFIGVGRAIPTNNLGKTKIMWL